ncbi:MAG TPA: cytochrome c peroxidase [Terracidiphilus sp.]|nr:cytochrome c peroxidase [Terracidiphilus sp.]
MAIKRKSLMASVLFFAGAVCIMGRTGTSAHSAKGSSLSPTAVLGKKIFSDRSLSASGKMACSTCHDPRFAYGPPDGSAVQYGGPDLKSPGYRAVPSLRYTLNRAPVWTYVRDTNPIEQLTEADTVPSGGFTWDGRFNSLHAQAMFPFFSPVEMDVRSVEALVKKLKNSAYAGEFLAVFGNDIFDHPKLAVEKATVAIEQFELEDRSFHPYTSKFDKWLDGKASLTPQELHGKQLFDDPNGGNCSSCHIDEMGANGAHPIFTDFQFEVLGVPRNNEITWNANLSYFDMGLCGPFRKDGASKDHTNCGFFRTPTLRNAAIRHVFFHNGRFHSLQKVLLFYMERDTNPEKWYPLGSAGKVEKFNDLPPQHRKNVDTIDAPLNRKLGQMPIWNEQDVEDVIAFLRTLTDQDLVDKEGTMGGVSARVPFRVTSMANTGMPNATF